MENETPAASGTGSRLFLIVVAVIAVVSLAFNIYSMVQLSDLQKAQQITVADVKSLNHRLGSTEADLKASTDELASKVGMTQQEFQTRLAARAAQIEKQQRASEERLSEQQKQAIGQVSTEVAGVKTDLGGAKTDIASTKTDLEATKAKLERAIGDLGVQSGLIAHTRDELEFLKHKGDRNYAEFTLTRGKNPVPVSTVSLQLKKVDPKKGKFTLNVLADDKTIEKKDRNLMEPLQFYTGRERQLYELVVFSMDKNQVSGYISTPKSFAPPAAQ